MNRLLLHGARYHHRPAVFLSPEGDTPDWRADRHAIRAALALQNAFGVGPGDVVGLRMPLSPAWAVLERGIWGLGAASLPLWPEWSRARVARALERERPRVVVASGDPDGLAPGDLLEQGGALDTPERASRFRAMAREIPPETIASIEPSPIGALSHAGWVARVRELVAVHPPRRGVRHVLEGERPELGARLVLHSGWADGVTTVAFGARFGNAGTESRRFVNLGAVDGGIAWEV